MTARRARCGVKYGRRGRICGRRPDHKGNHAIRLSLSELRAEARR